MATTGEVPSATEAPDWKRISAQLTTFAWKNLKRRSWETAKEVAQQAIADFFEDPEKWDRSKKTLLRHLGHEVLRITHNERRRARNAFEVAMDYVDLVEKEVDDGADLASEVLDRQQYAQAFDDRLRRELAGDDEALAVVALMKEEIDSPLAQAKASGLRHEALCAARRRVFYKADKLAKRMGDELDAEDSETQEEEVAQ